MADSERDSPDLPPATAEILEAWLRSRARPGPPGGEPPDATRLVAYLTGTLPAEERRALESELTRGAAGRGRLREAAAILDSLQAASPVEGADGRDERFAGEVARAWQEIVAAQAGAAVGARECWETVGWREVRRLAALGSAEALAAWAALAGIGEQVRAALRAPRWAVSRGEEALAAAAAGLPPGIRAVTRAAEVEPDGGLRVELALVDADGQAASELEGRPARLELAAGGEWWTISGAVVDGDGGVRWREDDLGAALGLPPGPVAAGFLRAAFDEAGTAASPGLAAVRAVVRDGSGAAVETAEVSVEKAARCEGGRLRVRVAVPAAARSLYPRHRLCLRLRVSARSSQHLGDWPLVDWGDEVRELEVLCPGVPEGPVPLLALEFSLEGGPSGGMEETGLVVEQ